MLTYHSTKIKLVSFKDFYKKKKRHTNVETQGTLPMKLASGHYNKWHFSCPTFPLVVSLRLKSAVTQLLDNVQMWTSGVPSTGVKLKPSKNYLHRVSAGPVGQSIKGRTSLSCSFLILRAPWSPPLGRGQKDTRSAQLPLEQHGLWAVQAHLFVTYAYFSTIHTVRSMYFLFLMIFRTFFSLVYVTVIIQYVTHTQNMCQSTAYVIGQASSPQEAIS